jgi:signal transduction histidine kinase
VTSESRNEGSSVAGLGRDLVELLRAWLPPIYRREFWAVQALVFVIALGHALLESVRPTIEPPALYLLPTSLYFVPVVYAALNFGLRGSLATALWGAVLTLPNTILWHSGLDRVGEVWQMAIVLAVAVFVGQRVDRETTARREAEERERERRSSEARYRGLFDNAAEAVLILEPDRTIAEANAAAATLLGRSMDALRGNLLDGIVGSAVAEQLILGTPQEVVALMGNSERRPTWVEPIVCLPRTRADGGVETQLMLHDVTSQHERQRDLEAYARKVLAAREEEQRRIGRELHDGPLQSLVLLWRKLDAIEDRGPVDRPSVAHDARELAEATADELRRISRALRPSVLDDLGLAAAIKSEATALARRAGIAVRFVHSGEEARLPTEIELALLRVAQEALHNVERHAAAAKVLVRLAFERDQVRLVVRDDGHGLDSLPSVSDLLDAGKLGLVGMQERVRLVGGQVNVRTRAGEGTTVEVSVPVGDRAVASRASV